MPEIFMPTPICPECETPLDGLKCSKCGYEVGIDRGESTLLERLQSATEGSRELSDECLLAWGWRYVGHIGGGDTGWRLPNGEALYTTHAHLFGAPHVTENVQHAIGEVPEGWVWTVGTDYELPGLARLHCNLPAADARPINIEARAATPALALCIAIEKALKE